MTPNTLHAPATYRTVPMERGEEEEEEQEEGGGGGGRRRRRRKVSRGLAKEETLNVTKDAYGPAIGRWKSIPNGTEWCRGYALSADRKCGRCGPHCPWRWSSR